MSRVEDLEVEVTTLLADLLQMNEQLASKQFELVSKESELANKEKELVYQGSKLEKKQEEHVLQGGELEKARAEVSESLQKISEIEETDDGICAALDYAKEVRKY